MTEVSSASCHRGNKKCIPGFIVFAVWGKVCYIHPSYMTGYLSNIYKIYTCSFSELNKDGPSTYGEDRWFLSLLGTERVMISRTRCHPYILSPSQLSMKYHHSSRYSYWTGTQSVYLQFINMIQYYAITVHVFLSNICMMSMEVNSARFDKQQATFSRWEEERPKSVSSS